MSNDVSSPSGAEAARKRLVIVAGVGRSGTSLFTTILGMTGFHVPQPEVQADSTNPKGFGEPQWVVDFHGRNLRSRRVSVWDSRPAAWEDTAQAAQDRNTFAELKSWLAVQFVGRDSVVVKDPRIGWFLPLWEKAAIELGVDVSFASLLRHPAEAVSSRHQVVRRLAVAGQPDPLVGQRHARDRVRHPRLAPRLRPLRRPARRLVGRDGPGRRGAGHPGPARDPRVVRRRVDEFVDPTLHRQKVTFADVGVPQQVEAMTEDVWKQFTALSVAGGDSAENRAVLDESRERYHAFYSEAEDIAQSTIHALRPRAARRREQGMVATQGWRLRRDGSSRGSGADAVIRLAERVVPPKLRRRVPPVWRSRIMRTANKVSRLARR